MVAVALAGHGSGHLGARVGVVAVGAILALDCITMLAPSNPSKLWLLNDQRPGRKEPNMMIIGVDYHPSFQTMRVYQASQIKVPAAGFDIATVVMEDIAVRI
jgi:hypothetical protein